MKNLSVYDKRTMIKIFICVNIIIVPFNICTYDICTIWDITLIDLIVQKYQNLVIDFMTILYLVNIILCFYTSRVYARQGNFITYWLLTIYLIYNSIFFLLTLLFSTFLPESNNNQFLQ
jgi:hypothetical protein